MRSCVASACSLCELFIKFFFRCFSPSSLALLAFVKRQILVALDRTRQNTPESWMSPSIVVYRSPDEASVFVIFLLRLWRSTSVYTSLHQVYATHPLDPWGGFLGNGSSSLDPPWIPLVVWGSTPPPLDEEFLIDAIVSASRNEAFKGNGSRSSARSSCMFKVHLLIFELYKYTTIHLQMYSPYIIHHNITPLWYRDLALALALALAPLSKT